MIPENKRRLRIALGFPEWGPFYAVMSGKPADATYVIQGNLAHGLGARGHSLTFVAPNSPQELIVTTDPLDARVARRTWSARRWFELTSKLVWRIQKLFGIPYLNVFSNYAFYDASVHALNDVDVIYERNGLYNVGLAMASKRLRIPYVIFFEADQIMELDILGNPITGLLRRRAAQLLRYNLNTADCIVCVTEAGRRHLINKWGVSEHKIVVFPNAVHVDRFKPDSEARSQIRLSLGMNDEPMIMFVGNFFLWHDVTTLLQAFAQTLKTCPQVRLVLVGDGERKSDMIKWASLLNLNEAIIFTGMVPHADIPRYMAAADIAVVPYPPMQQEMWLSPLKLFEYMASGKAVVASAVGQIVDVIRHGENGLLVPPGDKDALAGAINRLVADIDLRDRLGKQAREDALKNHSWKQYLSRLENVLNDVVNKK